MPLYDPTFLPDESDGLLDFFDLGEQEQSESVQILQTALADFAYQHGLGEFQLRDMIRQSPDRQTILLNGKTFRFRKDHQTPQTPYEPSYPPLI